MCELDPEVTGLCCVFIQSFVDQIEAEGWCFLFHVAANKPDYIASESGTFLIDGQKGI